jgi:uncharacterized DUF497 family protein
MPTASALSQRTSQNRAFARAAARVILASSIAPTASHATNACTVITHNVQTAGRRRRRHARAASDATRGSLDSVYTKCGFEWDPKKAAANLVKHGVSFDEAATIFAGPGALDGPEVGHSTAETRFLRVGQSILDRVLVVAYTERKGSHGEATRIISARRASRKERTAHGRSVED